MSDTQLATQSESNLVPTIDENGNVIYVPANQLEQNRQPVFNLRVLMNNENHLEIAKQMIPQYVDAYCRNEDGTINKRAESMVTPNAMVGALFLTAKISDQTIYVLLTRNGSDTVSVVPLTRITFSRNMMPDFKDPSNKNPLCSSTSSVMPDTAFYKYGDSGNFTDHKFIEAGTYDYLPYSKGEFFSKTQREVDLSNRVNPDGTLSYHFCVSPTGKKCPLLEGAIRYGNGEYYARCKTELTFYVAIRVVVPNFGQTDPQYVIAQVRFRGSAYGAGASVKQVLFDGRTDNPTDHLVELGSKQVSAGLALTAKPVIGGFKKLVTDLAEKGDQEALFDLALVRGLGKKAEEILKGRYEWSRKLPEMKLGISGISDNDDFTVEE